MVRAIISFLASVLAAVQAVLIYSGARALCLNDGCEIVDSMTTVSPLYFNIAGLLFFQTLFWLFLRGRYGSEYWHKLARLLLLAGLVAEAVLVFFQYSIAGIFCSYCLIIFAVIVLLNLCCGLRQAVRGAVLFTAVLAACFSLQFTPPARSGGTLDEGSIAMVSGDRDGIRLYLFFSASCGHCEKVIEAIGADNSCVVRFNPVERIENFHLSEAVLFPEYDPRINLALLGSLAIKEVPVLIAMAPDQSLVLSGEVRILEYLGKTCRKTDVKDGTAVIGQSGAAFLPGLGKAEDDGCAVSADCEQKVSPVSPLTPRK
jgi:hypothetical protein